MKNLDVNIKKFLELRGIPLVLATTILVTGLTGCSKKVDCEVEGVHAHLYTSDEGYSAYYNKEFLEYRGYSRSDEYISLTEEEAALNAFLDKKNLIRLDDNLDAILSATQDNQDYVEYEYSYIRRPLDYPVERAIERPNSRFYSWTTDPNHEDLTGDTRVCHYVYQGYNVQKDDNGNYVAVPSEQVDDIHDLIGNYEYVKKSYSKIVTLYDDKGIDYENESEEIDAPTK